jgi:hypothetical protein
VSWSLERDVATRFPFLLRYRQKGTPLLFAGRVRLERIAFLKLDCKESEVVCDPRDVEVMSFEKLAEGEVDTVKTRGWRTQP